MQVRANPAPIGPEPISPILSFSTFASRPELSAYSTALPLDLFAPIGPCADALVDNVGASGGDGSPSRGSQAAPAAR
jgi:hypothetical protein